MSRLAMPGNRSNKRVVWNNSDCPAQPCLRPPGTADWVQCDGCSRWFHLPCLHLELGELQEDKDFYCPVCEVEKQQEFDNIKHKLKVMVDELAVRQIEFGGVTIDRDYFKDKKNANPYNYSTDFPPTLKDLSNRIHTRHKTLADFKFDYKVMCKKLTENLKEDLESRIQVVEWELDDFVQDVFTEEETEKLKTEEEEDLVSEQIEDVVEQEDLIDYEENIVEPAGEKNDGGLCEHCGLRFTSPNIFSCKRSHKVCHKCRNSHYGAVCPICYQQYGERKRLFADSTTSMLFRLANATNFDSNKTQQIRPTKKMKVTEKTISGTESQTQPVIMNVWSCSEKDDLSFEPRVKKEPGLSLSTLADDSLSSKMITLINTDIVASTSPTSPDQQPINYNDPGPEPSSCPSVATVGSLTASKPPPPPQYKQAVKLSAWRPRFAQPLPSRFKCHSVSVRTVFVPDTHRDPLRLPPPPPPPLLHPVLPRHPVPRHLLPSQLLPTQQHHQHHFTEEEEDTFITPDRIQESFDQIEKFIVAEDDNIFESSDVSTLSYRK